MKLPDERYDGEFNLTQPKMVRKQCECVDCSTMLPAGTAATTYYGRWDGMWYVARHCAYCAGLWIKAREAFGELPVSEIDDDWHEEDYPTLGELIDWCTRYNKYISRVKGPEFMIYYPRSTQ